MRTTDKIYHILVNRLPGIKERYKSMRYKSSEANRLFAWCYLGYLNIAYYVFRNREIGIPPKCTFYETKTLYDKGSESSLSKREQPVELATKLAKYDVISFDVFDTLIFRPFSSPTDLFYLLESKLNYMDFKRIREEMEGKARVNKYQKTQSYEVSLEEIYDVLSTETGIKKNETMNMELELEYEYCFANPYMIEVVKHLVSLKKKIIITSDMYLSAAHIKEILKRCGYPDFAKYYVSCDQGISKSQGELYRLIKKAHRKEQTLVHVGDNYGADVVQAKKYGFKPFHYVNVNSAGAQFRAEDMSVITGGFYRGIVNAHIHNGLKVYSREYEYGYIYGGLFVTGYCQFIHQYISANGIDTALFLARDGDILLKVYQLMYPQETVKLRYVYWSRLTATKMGARKYKYDYFRRFLYHKINQKYTLAQIFTSMEIEDILPDFCHHSQLKPATELTSGNVEQVKDYLVNSWGNILGKYEEQLAAGKQYFEPILKNSKKAIAVDVGWAGSGAVVLDYIVNEIWGQECSITAVVAGTNTCHNAEPNTSETFLQSGKMVSYLYSQRENRDLWKLHNPEKGHNLCWELLLGAPSGSFKGFYLSEDEKCDCQFRKAPKNIKEIKEIQKGMMDFVKQYETLSRRLKELSIIGGRDAYAPMVNVANSSNKKLIESISNIFDDVNVN